MDEPYYRRDLALVHHLGYGFHADRTSESIVQLLAPVRVRDGLVLEIGCGSGLLTRYLIDAGHRVLATDASPAMLDLARDTVPDAAGLEMLTLPDDPVPEADAIVGIGHALNYLPDEESLNRALVALAQALRPGGTFAIDLCDIQWGTDRVHIENAGRVGDDWAIVALFSVPRPNLYVREMTTFVRDDDGTWRRDFERHDNVLVDTSLVPALLAEHGVDAEVRDSFVDEELPSGLKAIVGRKPE